MDLAVVNTCCLVGMDAKPVSVEVHIGNGLPAFNIVGLPETSVKEAKDRVRSAIINSGFRFPSKRITVNLAPADLPKSGGRFDLPIALGILAAAGDLLRKPLEQSLFVGELALSGALRSVDGAVATALAFQEHQYQLYLAAEDAQQAVRVPNTVAYACESLQQLTEVLNGQAELSCCQMSDLPPPEPASYEFDMADVYGQAQAKRALELAAAGRHNLLMLGPPGTGKTMLASRLPGILPALEENQAIELAALNSIIGSKRKLNQWYLPPFRSPHHSASMVALVGGGSNPKPGEISLAHHGVLFLDELAEFPRSVLDALRQPLESAEIHISRAKLQLSYPADFQLIAAMNPSPCGYYQGPHMRSNPDQVLKYINRISGPLLDRFDLSIELSALPIGRLSTQANSEASAQIRLRVEAARKRQWERQGKLNYQLNGRELQQHASLTESDIQFLEESVSRLGLSARAFHRIWRLARTIADLEGLAVITQDHLVEALGYRGMDQLLATLQRS